MKKITNNPEYRKEIFYFTPDIGAKYLDPSTGRTRFITKYSVMIRDERTNEVLHFSNQNTGYELLLLLSEHKAQAIYCSDPKIRIETGVLLNTAAEDCRFEGAALICVELERELWCLQYVNSTVSPIQSYSIWTYDVCSQEFIELCKRLMLQLHKLSIADFEAQLKAEMNKFCPIEDEDDKK